MKNVNFNKNYWLYPSLFLALGFTLSMNHESALNIVRNETSPKVMNETLLASEGIQLDNDDKSGIKNVLINGNIYSVNYTLKEEEVIEKIKQKNKKTKKTETVEKKTIHYVGTYAVQSLNGNVCASCNTNTKTYKSVNDFKNDINNILKQIEAANPAKEPQKEVAKPAEEKKDDKDKVAADKAAQKEALKKLTKELEDKCKSKKENAENRCHINEITKLAKRIEKSPEAPFLDGESLDAELLKTFVTDYYLKNIKSNLESLLATDRFEHENFDRILGFNTYTGYMVGNFDRYSKDSFQFEEGKAQAQKLISDLSKATGEDIRSDIAKIMKESYRNEAQDYSRLIREGKDQNNIYKFNSGLQMMKDLQYDVQDFVRTTQDYYRRDSNFSGFSTDYGWANTMMEGIRNLIAHPENIYSDGNFTRPALNTANRNTRGNSVPGISFTTPGTQNPNQPVGTSYNPNQPWATTSMAPTSADRVRSPRQSGL